MLDAAESSEVHCSSVAIGRSMMECLRSATDLLQTASELNDFLEVYNQYDSLPHRYRTFEVLTADDRQRLTWGLDSLRRYRNKLTRRVYNQPDGASTAIHDQ